MVRKAIIFLPKLEEFSIQIEGNIHLTNTIGLENNILNEEYYLEFIENEVKLIINKLVEFCEENSLNYNLNLDNFNADYIFI